jgi:hypothetical protein
MIATPTLKDVFNQYEMEQHAIECIVLAPKFHSQAYSEFIQRIGYINIRSGESINFYCAGYGAYIPESEVYDLEKLPYGREYEGVFIPWTFSASSFGEFVNELESVTNWEYSGRTEIIVLGRESIFKDCIILKIEEMVNDEVVSSPSEVIEMIIRASKDKTLGKMITENVEKISGEMIADSLLAVLPKPFEKLSKAWNKGRHYAIINLQ